MPHPLFDLLATPEPWRARAACLGMGPALFYPADAAEEAPAKAVCHDCPVQAQCGEYALTHKEPAGIWGGTNDHERTGIRHGLDLNAPRRRCAWCTELVPVPRHARSQQQRYCGTRCRNAANNHKQTKQARKAS